MKHALEITDLSYTYAGTDRPVIEGVSLRIRRGECVCITGPSGCGKTTLLLAIQGLLKEGRLEGVISTGANGTTGAVGMVFQNADTQILCTTVEDEVAFGPLNMKLSPESIETNVKQALEAVGLVRFEQRNVEQLSAGEKQRVTIASVLSMQPGLLLLDEPTAQLDGPGKTALAKVLKELKACGHALLIADHDLSVFRSIADRVFAMHNGSLEESSSSMPDHGGLEASAKTHRREANFNDGDAPLAIIEELGLDGSQNHSIFRQATLTIHRGECIHLYGLNGAGKSSLLRHMVGLEKENAKRRMIVGIDDPRPERLVGKVGLLFQNPDSQLFEDTVYDEVAYCLKRLGIEQGTIERRVMDSLEQCRISHLAKRSPLMLSYGEKHRVALASVMAPKPALLLLDEPFSGLDFSYRKRTLDLLHEYSRTHGASVVIVSHDPLPDPNWADRCLILENGRIKGA